MLRLFEQKFPLKNLPKIEKIIVIRTPHSYFSHSYAYPKTKSLTLQFILYEFLKVCEVLKPISLLLAKEEQSLSQLAEGLETQWAKLVRAPHDCRQIFSYGFEEGRLLKLRHFCGLLLRDKIMNDPIAHTLYQRADQMVQSAFTTLCSLEFFIDQEGASPISFVSSLKKTLNLILLTSSTLEKMIESEGKDENILLLLLENAPIAKSVFGEQYFEKLFKRISSHHTQGALRFLITQYTNRGFAHLIPWIQKLASDINL